MGLTLSRQPPSEHLYVDLDADGVFETDISAFLKSVQVGYGRASALDAFTPRQLISVLDNTGSEFSPRNLDSPYWPGLKRGKRVQAWSDLTIEQVNNLIDNPSAEVDDTGYGNINSATHVRSDAGFFDGFEAGASLDWTSYGGNWAWVATSSRVEGWTAGPNELLRDDFEFQDGWIEAVISRAEDGCGIVARWQDVSNYYFLRVHDDGAGSEASTVRLYKRVSGTDTALGAATVAITFTRDKHHVFRLEIRGSILRAYVDGELVATVTDSAITAGGAAGFRVDDSVRSYFDSAQARDLDYQSRFGKASVKYTAADLTLSGMVLTLRNGDRPVAVTGHSYVFLHWMRTAPGVGFKNMHATVAFYDAATGGGLRQIFDGAVTVVGEDWTPVFVAATLTVSAATHVEVRGVTYLQQGVFDFFVDGCMLYEFEETASPTATERQELPTTVDELEPYCDGDQAHCVWDGTAHQGTSRRSAGPKTQNLMRNPSGETNTTFFSGVSATLSRVSIDARRGGWAIQINGTSTDGFARQAMDGAPILGQVYSAGVDVKGTGDATWVWISIEETGGAEATAKTTSFALTSHPKEWARLTIVHTVQESDRTGLRIEVRVFGSSPHETLTDGWQLELQNAPTPYCDGDQENCSWDGTEHASTSQRIHLVKQFTGKIREFEFTRWTDDTPVAELTATGKMETLANDLVVAGPFTRKPAKWVLQRLLDLLTPGQSIKDAANRYWGDDMVERPGCLSGSPAINVNTSGKGGSDPEMYTAIEGDDIKYIQFVGGSSNSTNDPCGWELTVTDRTEAGKAWRAAIWLSTSDSAADGLNVRFDLFDDDVGIVASSINALVIDNWIYVEIEGTWGASSTSRKVRLTNDDAGWDSLDLLPDYFWDGLQLAPAENTLPQNFSGKWWDEDIEYMDAYFRSANVVLEELAKSAAGWFFEDVDGDLVFEDITARSPNTIPALRLSDVPNDGAPYALSRYREPVTGQFTDVKVGSFGDITLLPGDGRLVWNLEPMPKVIGADGVVIYRAAFAGDEGDALVGRNASVLKETSAGGFGSDPEGSGITTPILLNYGRAADVLVVAGGSGVTIELLSIEARVQNRSNSERSFVQETVPGDESPLEERTLSLDTPAQGHQTTLMRALARWAAEKYGKGPIVFETALNGTSLQSILEIVAVSPGTSAWLKHMDGPGAFKIDALFYIEKVELVHEISRMPELSITMEEA